MLQSVSRSSVTNKDLYDGFCPEVKNTSFATFQLIFTRYPCQPVTARTANYTGSEFNIIIKSIFYF